MKITKAKLKQIIKEELSSLAEADAVSHHADGWDAGGTSQVYSQDVEGVPPEGEQADPLVTAIATAEGIGDLIRNGDPGGEGALSQIEELINMLKDMNTEPGNATAMARWNDK